MYAVAEESVGLAFGERGRPGVGVATGGVILGVLLALGLSVLVQIA